MGGQPLHADWKQLHLASDSIEVTPSVCPHGGGKAASFRALGAQNGSHAHNGVDAQHGSTAAVDGVRVAPRFDDARDGASCLNVWLEWATATPFAKGRLSLPWQRAGYQYMHLLILVPLAQIASLVATAVIAVPFATKCYLAQVASGQSLSSSFVSEWPVLGLTLAAGFVGNLGAAMVQDMLTVHCLHRGLQRPELPTDRARLIHAVIICAYKEPYDVLATTIRSLGHNHLAGSTILILATEARDETACPIFERLKTEFGHKFHHFFQTRHVLLPGEVAGKSSNERHACMELYEYVKDRGIEPYSVMVTTADADSQFDKVFLEQLEAEYCRQPDGRHVLFDSPINTYRNLAACNPLVAVFEIERTQYCTFSALHFQPCQSNYSLTLGFAHLIDYWHPDNTSEDLHTTLKAIAFTNAAANVVVPVWSLILNDSVTGMHDRWVQAKRHMWGIEETAWVCALFPLLRWKPWLRMLELTAGKMLTTTVVPPWLLVLFPQSWAFARALQPSDRNILVGAWLLRVGFVWGKALYREAALHGSILRHRQKAMLPISVLQWAHLALCYPFYAFLAGLIFNTFATWAMLLHAMHSVTYGYVTAPKELSGQLLDALNEDSCLPSRAASVRPSQRVSRAPTPITTPMCSEGEDDPSPDSGYRRDGLLNQRLAGDRLVGDGPHVYALDSMREGSREGSSADEDSRDNSRHGGR